MCHHVKLAQTLIVVNPVFMDTYFTENIQKINVSKDLHVRIIITLTRISRYVSLYVHRFTMFLNQQELVHYHVLIIWLLWHKTCHA